MSNDQIQAMVDLVAHHREHLSIKKVAIVAGDEWETPKLAEVGLQAVSIVPIVFNELAAACRWLDVEEPEVDRDILQMRRKLQQNP